MASRNRAPVAAYPPSNASRQNEYFVPRDGIDREVITADICRYLGNDALVRPGTLPDNDGRTIQGYFITAYRNLTTAMIADLKNDSARWEAERRKHQSGTVRYQDSQIRDVPGRPERAQAPAGYNNGPAYQYSSGAREYDNGARTQGNDTPGYNNSGPGSAGHYGTSAGMGGYGAGPQYAQGHNQPASYQPPVSSAQDPRYGAPPAPIGGAGGYGSGGIPISQDGGYVPGGSYAVASSRIPSDGYPMDMAMSDAPMPAARRTSPPGGANPYGVPVNPRAAYDAPPAQYGASRGGYGGFSQPSVNTNQYAQPIDNGYGRAPTSNNSFSPAHEVPPQQPPPPQAQQYEAPMHSPSPPRPGTVSNTQAQLSTNSGLPTGPRRDRERAVSDRPDHRDRDRPEHIVDRDVDRDHMRDGTPPSRTGSATKPGSSTHHHYGGRR